MCSLEPLIEEELMQLREFRWLVGESTTLQFAIVSRRAHGTERFHRGIVSFSTDTCELVPEYLFIEFYVMP